MCVSREYQTLAWLIRGQDERSQSGEVRWRRRQAPRRFQRSALEGARQFVAWQDDHVVENPEPWCEHRRKRDAHRGRIHSGDDETFAVNLEGLGCAGVVNGVE